VGRLSGPGPLSAPPDLRPDDLPPLPLDDGRPFREPWQAKAFALVVLLHREGHLAWDDWVQTLAAEIRASPQRADEDADQAYHRQFLAALERVVAARGLVELEAMVRRKQAWRKAYLNTPHGQPVDLAAADTQGDHDHDDGHHHGHGLEPQYAPIAVSPAQALSR
jgi:nitrile hydratase accessory protein